MKSVSKLQQKWNKILAKEGLDIEDTVQFRWHSRDFYRYSIEEYTAKERYYQLATQLVHTYPFKDARERKIWTMHAEGATTSVIEKEVKKSHGTVINTITRIAKCIKT